MGKIRKKYITNAQNICRYSLFYHLTPMEEGDQGTKDLRLGSVTIGSEEDDDDWSLEFPAPHPFCQITEQTHNCA
jgi:hypothetical protein